MTSVAFAGSRYDGSVWLPLVLASLAASVLAFLPFPQNVVVIAAGAAFVVAVLNPPLALGLLVASVPVQALGERSLGPVNLTLTKVVLLWTAASWAGHLLTRRRPIRLDRITLAYAAYVIVLALSVANAPSGASWGTELYRWWSPLLAYVVAINVLGDLRQGRPVVAATALSVIAVSVYGIVQAAQGIGPDAFSAGGMTRAYATFGQPNPFAGYLGLTTPLLVALAASWLLPEARPALRRWFGAGVVLLAGTGAALGLVALLLTQSRGGWLGTAAGLAAVAWLLGNRVRWLATGAAIAVLAGVALTPHGARVSDRLAGGVGLASAGVQVTPENFAVQERLAHWRAGWAMAQRYPLLGVGAGGFSDRYREFTQVWRFRISRGHAHNAYIHAAAQTGFLGLATYLLFVVTVGVQLWRARRAAADAAARAVTAGVIGVSLAFAVHGLVNYLHVLSLPVQLACAWALASAASSGRAPLLGPPVDRPSERPTLGRLGTRTTA